MKKLTVFLFIIILIFGMLPGFCQAGMKMEVGKDFISGQVFYLANHKGIGDLVVKLTPPRNFREVVQKEIILVTDKNGQFKFTGLPKGKYLLELYEGPTLLYRDMVDMYKENNKTIILKGEGRRFEQNIPLKVIPPEFRL
jgi:hypothetical protein